MAEAIRRGDPPLVAARMAGVDRATFYRWLEQGQKDEAAGHYRDFRDTIERAQAAFQDDMLGVISSAAGTREQPKNWVAAMTLLERRFPARALCRNVR